MNKSPWRSIVLIPALASRPVAVGASAADAVFRAGAARVDITPPKGGALRMSGYGGRVDGYTRINDPLHVRAIVVDDGSTQAAIVACDLAGISHRMWQQRSADIAKATGIPVEHILLAGTHTHGGPSLGWGTDDPDGRSPASAVAKAYADDVNRKIVDAVKSAQSSLQPARFGAGTGQANVNMNRRARVSNGGYWLGANPDGPSDKTVAVVKFETLNGDPLAIFINYGVHATVLGAKNFAITGDLAGATSRFVERQFAGKVVVPWTSGAGGDQRPLYSTGEKFEEMESLGRILGEEAIRVAATIRPTSRVHVRGSQRVVTCPGQIISGLPKRRDDLKYEFLDGPPLDIRLSLLTLNQVAFCGVSAEVLTMIGQRLKRESPFTNTIMVTHCNGSSGYIPDDAAYDQISYEIVQTRAKRGHAENAIVNGFLEMIDEAANGPAGPATQTSVRQTQ